LAPNFSGANVTAPSPIAIPKTTHGFIMLAATLLAMVGAWAWSRTLAGGAVAADVLIALGIGSIATFAPVFLRIGPDHWGVAVLFSGTARAILVLGACYLIAQNHPDLPERPLFLPAVGAAVFLLAVESINAVRIISDIDRQKTSHKAAGTPVNSH
jgi:hypothetical protein